MKIPLCSTRNRSETLVKSPCLQYSCFSIFIECGNKIRNKNFTDVNAFLKERFILWFKFKFSCRRSRLFIAFPASSSNWSEGKILGSYIDAAASSCICAPWNVYIGKLSFNWNDRIFVRFYSSIIVPIDTAFDHVYKANESIIKLSCNTCVSWKYVGVRTRRWKNLFKSCLIELWTSAYFTLHHLSLESYVSIKISTRECQEDHCTPLQIRQSSD